MLPAADAAAGGGCTCCNASTAAHVRCARSAAAAATRVAPAHSVSLPSSIRCTCRSRRLAALRTAARNMHACARQRPRARH